MPPDVIGPGRSHAQIADHNSRALLEALRRNGPMTRSELAALTGLTTAGISNVIRRHMADGLVAETGSRRTPNAQVPSAEYALVPERALSIGLRIKADRVEGLLVDLAGMIHARATRATAEETAGALMVARSSANLIGIGIAGSEHSIAAPVDLPTELVIRELDTIAAAICQRSFEAEMHANGTIIILLEERIRACLLLHARPFAGVHGRAGRIGEMLTGRDRRPLDLVCASSTYFAAAKRGPEAIERWIDTAAEHLLDALLALTSFIGPGRIVVAGDLPREVLEALITAIEAAWSSQKQESPPPALPPIETAVHAGESVTVGAAMLPFLHVLLPQNLGA
jgi:predicted NBD/HSP70 family sugar kinase